MIFKKYIFQIPTESKSIQLIMAVMEQGGEEGIQYVCEGSSFVCMTHERSGCPWSLCVCVYGCVCVSFSCLECFHWWTLILLSTGCQLRCLYDCNLFPNRESLWSVWRDGRGRGGTSKSVANDKHRSALFAQRKPGCAPYQQVQTRWMWNEISFFPFFPWKIRLVALRNAT